MALKDWRENTSKRGDPYLAVKLSVPNLDRGNGRGANRGGRRGGNGGGEYRNRDDEGDDRQERNTGRQEAREPSQDDQDDDELYQGEALLILHFANFLEHNKFLH